MMMQHSSSLDDSSTRIRNKQQQLHKIPRQNMDSRARVPSPPPTLPSSMEPSCDDWGHFVDFRSPEISEMNRKSISFRQ